ncbi:MAG: hypothetical protein AB7F86_08295 [Bdellovibrionales bacterium]
MKAQEKAIEKTADENCRELLIKKITEKAKAGGLKSDFGVQFYENEPYEKAGLDKKKRQLYKYTTPPFVVDEGYIPDSQAIALVRFTDKSCEIEKLTVKTGY